VNFGLLESFRNSDRNEFSYSELYRRHLDLAVEAEELGYDTIWLTEHHFVEDGYSPAMMPLGAAIATRTKKIRIGTFVLLMPLHHPLHVAEQAVTLDVLSNGRFDLGLGQGYRPQEFEGFNISRAERASRLREGVEIIRRVLSEDNVSYEGKHFTVRNVTLYPKPVQKPVPIWIGARARTATERAARNGYHLAGTVPEQADIYREALRAAGRNPADFHVAQLRFGYVAARRDKAWDDAEYGVHHLMAKYGQWLSEAADVAGDEHFAQVPAVGELRKLNEPRFLGEPLIIGSPDDVIKLLERYTNYTHLALGMALPGIDPKKVRASMRLFAKEVIPHFRRKARAAEKLKARAVEKPKVPSGAASR
jgi:probable F420-dependent oxidoreductase